MENKNTEVPEGYKKKELGIIPEEWEVEEIKIQVPFPEIQISQNVEKLLGWREQYEG